jgi:hypothetical protein
MGCVSFDGYLSSRWRTGRHNGRVLYAQLGPEPDDSDPMIGSMDTPELGARVVRDHNAALGRTVRLTLGPADER